MTTRRQILAATAIAAPVILTRTAHAEDVIRIGLITPLTGPFASTGEEHVAAVKLYMAQHGDMVAGKKIELIIKDDASVPDTTKRLAQELIVNEHVQILAGMGLTPLALAVAPLATQAKVPLVVMGAATSSIPAASPYIVRSSFSVPQVASVIGDWAAKNGFKTAMTMVSDYGPGIDNEVWFRNSFEAAGGKMLGALRVPLANPDFAPFLQRVADAKPDGLYIFVPSGIGSTLMRQFTERGMEKSGVKLIGSGDVLDDELMDQIGDVSLGVVSAYHYSDAHDSALNRSFTAGVEKSARIRANMMGVGGYDGMALIYKALELTKGDASGPALLAAMKGLSWESPRGPVSIDPDTRDIIQNVYLRKVQKVNGRLENVEFQTYPAVKDPAKASAKTPG